jgi:hypothetical protein
MKLGSDSHAQVQQCPSKEKKNGQPETQKKEWSGG